MWPNDESRDLCRNLVSKAAALAAKSVDLEVFSPFLGAGPYSDEIARDWASYVFRKIEPELKGTPENQRLQDHLVANLKHDDLTPYDEAFAPTIGAGGFVGADEAYEVVISIMIRRYFWIARVPAFDEQKFEATFNYISSCTSGHVEQVTVAPLASFSGEYADNQAVGPVTFRRVNRRELEEWVYSGRLLLRHEVNAPTWCIEHRGVRPRPLPASPRADHLVINEVLSLARLMTGTAISACFSSTTYTCLRAPSSTILGVSGLNPLERYGPRQAPNAGFFSSMTSLLALHQKTFGDDAAALPDWLRVALRWHAISLIEPHADLRVAAAATTLECALLRRKDPKQRTLVQRSSLMFPPQDQARISKQVNEAYDLRCDIVHEGRQLNSTTQADQAVSTATEVLQRVYSLVTKGFFEKVKLIACIRLAATKPAHAAQVQRDAAWPPA